MGWKILPLPQEQPPRSIICVAPHTSNMDFLIGKLYYTAVGKPSSFLMKKDWFFFPLGPILRSMGGIAVDRSRKEDTVGRLVDFISRQSEMHIGITPEGTRSYVDKWKTGFYRIAHQANIPIEIAVIDYKRREVGIFEIFHPTGDVEADIAYIHSKFSSSQARHPHKYNDNNP